MNVGTSDAISKGTWQLRLKQRSLIVVPGGCKATKSAVGRSASSQTTEKFLLVLLAYLLHVLSRLLSSFKLSAQVQVPASRP